MSDDLIGYGCATSQIGLGPDYFFCTYSQTYLPLLVNSLILVAGHTSTFYGKIANHQKSGTHWYPHGSGLCWFSS